MCGRYNLRITSSELQEFFDLFRDVPFDWQPRYNIAPTQEVVAFRFDEDTAPRCPVLLRWGLIPSWAKDVQVGSRMINARAESVAEKPSFRAAFKRRRCIIPATGYYEWKKAASGKAKQPYHIHREDDEPFGLAGLWERWSGGDGSDIESCTILTTDASEPLDEIHNRMPVILHATDYDRWLDPLLQDKDDLLPLLVDGAYHELTATPISTTVNNPRNETPDCITPLEPP